MLSSLTTAPGTRPPQPGLAASYSPGRTVARGALALLSTQPLTWTASLIAAAIIPRYLGDTLLGQYAALMTITGLVGTAASLGIPEHLVRRVATAPDSVRREAATAILLLTAAASIGATGLGLILPLTGFPVPEPAVFATALLAMAIAPAQTIIQAVLRGQERHASYAWLTAGSVVIGTATTLLMLLAGWGIMGLLASGLITNIAMTVLNWRVARLSMRWHVSTQQAWNLFCVGAPFLAWTVTMKFYNEIDRVMLGMLVPVQVVGWYAAAIRIVGIPVFVPTAIMTPMFPALSREATNPLGFCRTLRASLRITMLVTVPTCAGIAALAPVVPSILGWSENFGGSILPMQILAPNLVIISLDMLLGTALLALRKEKQWLWVAVVAAIVNPSLNLVLIPRMQQMIGNGSVGAAVTTLATELVMLIGAFLLLPRGVIDSYTAWSTVRIFAAGLLTYAAAASLLVVSVPLAICSGALVYAASLLSLRVITPTQTRHDIDRLRSHFRSTPAAL